MPVALCLQEDPGQSPGRLAAAFKTRCLPRQRKNNITAELGMERKMDFDITFSYLGAESMHD